MNYSSTKRNFCAFVLTNDLCIAQILIRIREALDIVHTILASSSGHTERDDPSDASFSCPATITASISEGQKAWVRGCYSA